MPIEVEIIEDRIPELIIHVNANARRAVKAVADKIAVTARGFVAKDTWALNDTIRTESVQYGHEAQVLAGDGDVDYAFYQEYGTYKMAAHPFMGPAIEQHTWELPVEIAVGFEGLAF